MTGNEYQELAMRTSNGELSAEMHMINGVLGLCGEGGEVADLVKKHMMQGHALDAAHAAKELGDCLWYIAEAATAIGWELDDIMQLNIDKLMARYPDGFDPKRSINRKKGDL